MCQLGIGQGGFLGSEGLTGCPCVVRVWVRCFSGMSVPSGESVPSGGPEEAGDL